SFFGGCINVVHAPDERALDNSFPPFGWSGPSLTDGYAIVFSSRAGAIDLAFSLAEGRFAELTLSHGNGLLGFDGLLSAPNGYGLVVKNNRVRDVIPNSHGRVDIQTGRVHDFHYNVMFANSAID